MSFALLAGLLVVAAVVLFIVQPLLTGESAPFTRAEDEPTDADARKRVALMALRDVEYDFATGKLDSTDYEELRGELAAEALAAIEAGAQPGRRAAGATAQGADEIELEIARFRVAYREGVTCPSCGRPNGPGSRFCGGCGGSLPEASAVAGG